MGKLSNEDRLCGILGQFECIHDLHEETVNLNDYSFNYLFELSDHNMYNHLSQDYKINSASNDEFDKNACFDDLFFTNKERFSV